MSKESESVYCWHCNSTYPVTDPPAQIAPFVERFFCKFERRGEPCQRPFWHCYSRRMFNKRLALQGIEPHRLPEWQS